MKNISRKNVYLIVAAVLLLALSAFFVDRSSRKQAVYEKLNIEFNEKDVEYGSSIKAKDLIRSYEGELSIDKEIDTYDMNEQKLIYTVSTVEERYKQIVEKIYEHTVQVKDSKPPVIEIEKDTVYAYVNSPYDLKENISVYDEVDGPIDNYQIATDYDPEKAGEYSVNITAYDKNGLSSNGSYQLIVRNRVSSPSEGYDIIYSILTSAYGYNRAAACGILANIRFESNFIPDIGDYYYGLCQWGGSRKDNLYSYCAANGLDPAGIDGQLSFLDHELSTSYSGVKTYLLNVENSSNGAFEAGDYFCRYYEGAASADGRGDLAVSYFGS